MVVQQQRGLASCLVWSHMPREIKIFQRRGSVNILQFTRCVQSVKKNTRSMNTSSSNPAQSSELTKYFKGSGTWWMRKYYFNIRSHEQIPLHVPLTLVPRDVTAPSRAAEGGNLRRSKVWIYQISILELPHAHTLQDTKADMQWVKWSVCEILLCNVLHYTCWQMIYN